MQESYDSEALWQAIDAKVSDATRQKLSVKPRESNPLIPLSDTEFLLSLSIIEDKFDILIDAMVAYYGIDSGQTRAD